MVISFSVANYRSFREEQELVLTTGEPESGRAIPLDVLNESLLTSAVVYGQNASGKSNLIRAIWTLRTMVLLSTEAKRGDPIPWYEPFLLDAETLDHPAPVRFTLEFVMNPFLQPVRYRYEVAFSRTRIESEVLYQYTGKEKKNARSRIFIRKNGEEVVKLGNLFKDKDQVQKRVLSNHLFLTQTGNSPHVQMGEIYSYFKDMLHIWNATERSHLARLDTGLRRQIFTDSSGALGTRVGELLKVGDTQIDKLMIAHERLPDIEQRLVFPVDIDTDLKNRIIQSNQEHFSVKTRHIIDSPDGSKLLKYFDLDTQESVGTKALFAIGGLFLSCLENGGTIFFDEFGSSLHPDLSQFLVGLFMDPMVNKASAQLFFATHETTLLDDSDLFQKEQIWFTQKNKSGATELFSAQDFGGIRPETPLYKWYKTGKFGAKPNIRQSEFRITLQQPTA